MRGEGGGGVVPAHVRITHLASGVSRWREVEQDVVTLRAQLVEKQAVQTENDRLKLQVDSMQAQSLMEQRKSGEERSEVTRIDGHQRANVMGSQTIWCFYLSKEYRI